MSSASPLPLSAFGRYCTLAQMQRLQESFNENCEQANLSVPKKCLTEFNKRMQALSNGRLKPKLNFRSCSLSDGHIDALLSAMEISPSILKLDLRSNNLSNESLRKLSNFLEKQLKFVASTPADSRLFSILLSFVDCSSNSSAMDPSLFDEITTMLEILAYNNALTFVRQSYLKFCGQAAECSWVGFEKTWVEVFGKRPRQDRLNITPLPDGSVRYSDLEASAISKFQMKNICPRLSKFQRQLYSSYQQMCVQVQSPPTAAEQSHDETQEHILQSLTIESDVSEYVQSQPENDDDVQSTVLTERDGADNESDHRTPIDSPSSSPSVTGNGDVFDDEQIRSMTGESLDGRSDTIADDSRLMSNSDELVNPSESKIDLESSGLTSIRLSGFPADVDLKRIRMLVLSSNCLKTISFSSFSELIQLEELDLSKNEIVEISERPPKLLKKLNLSSNSIRSMDCLLESDTLLELDVSSNKIKTPSGLPAKSLVKLNIARNLISSVMNLRLISICHKLREVSVDGNPFVDNVENWRAQILSMLPSLDTLNGQRLPRGKSKLSAIGTKTSNDDVETKSPPVNKHIQRQLDQRRYELHTQKLSRIQRLVEEQNYMHDLRSTKKVASPVGSKDIKRKNSSVDASKQNMLSMSEYRETLVQRGNDFP